MYCIATAPRCIIQWIIIAGNVKLCVDGQRLIYEYSAWTFVLKIRLNWLRPVC